MILDRVQSAPPGQYLHFRDVLGRPCSVWTMLALPPGPGPWPVVIHCPGGGQAVAEADLAFWNQHGFACATFDWQVGAFSGHDPTRKSLWPAGVVAQSEPAARPGQLILPLAVRAIGALIDWLETDPRLDAGRIGLTGISWGGYLTWVANAHEPRLRAAVPVYGCGGQFDPAHGYPLPLSAAARNAWRAEWDPLRLAGRQRSPVCFLSGSDDFFGWPRFADRQLAAVPVPSRRCYAANLDHAVDPAMSALAVAWMDRWLRHGPALPPEPQPGDEGEAWWTCSTGADDRACWWPGRAPAWATARFVRVRHGDMALSSRIEHLRPTRSAPPLPAVWTDVRAGLGWNWGLSTTQLHGNQAVSMEPLSNDPTRATIIGNRAGDLGVILRMTADPRWNRRGFAGLRVRLAGLTRAPVALTAVFCPERRGGRPAHPVPLTLDAEGWARLDRLPAGLTWAETSRIELNGVPGPRFVLGPIEALPIG